MLYRGLGAAAARRAKWRGAAVVPNVITHYVLLHTIRLCYIIFCYIIL